ncbi:MAG: OsmC family protein, partial [Gammaproteobacteria bacterium]|nr:OsmC family protein [Gammaproteobacteria bacterium]
NPIQSGVEIQIEGSAEAGFGPMSFRSGGHEIPVDVAPRLGGTDDGPTPLAHALIALGSCQLATYRWWAARLELAVDDLDVVVTADLDLRGLLGTDDHVGAGPASGPRRRAPGARRPIARRPARAVSPAQSRRLSHPS